MKSLAADNSPTTLEEAVEGLVKIAEQDDPGLLARVKSGEFDPQHLHHGTGTEIRNAWGLWKHSPLARWFYERGIYHADDMSGIILDAFGHKMRGEPFDLVAKVRHYQQFWAQGRHDPKNEVARDLKIKGLPPLPDVLPEFMPGTVSASPIDVPDLQNVPEIMPQFPPRPGEPEVTGL